MDLRPRGPIGFRLVHELEGLLHGIAADGNVSAQEAERLGAWLDANRQHSDVHPFSELALRVELAVSDGVLSSEECEDLLFVVSRFTTVNPHFDQLRGGIQVLLGVLSGVAADGVLNDEEVLTLQQWVENWRHLKGLWPYDECDSVVTSMVAEKRMQEQTAAIFAIAQQLPVAGAVDTPPLLVRGICAVDPEVVFADKTFVFTGESPRGARDVLEGRVVERGGRAHPTVTKKCDYLVVCPGCSEFWAFSCYGRKVEKAYLMRREGHHVQIIHERDFWDALQ